MRNELNREISLKRIELMQIIGLTVLLITIGFWQLMGVNYTSSFVFLVGVFSLYLSAISGIRYRVNSFVIQRDELLLIVLGLIFEFYLMINRSPIQNKIGHGVFWMVAIGIGIAAILQIIHLLLTWKKIMTSTKIWKSVLPIVILGVVIGFAFNLECFNAWPRNDNYSYFFMLQRLSVEDLFLPKTEGLMIGSHLSPTYALWSLLFMSIPHISDLNALYLSNMFLIFLDVILFFLLFKQLMPRKSTAYYMVYTTIAAGAPWILGMAAGISPEFLMTSGILMLLYAVMSENTLLAVFSVFVVCGSRELGGLVAASILAIQFFYDPILSEKRNPQGKGRNARWVHYISCYSLGIMWLIQLPSSRWMMQSRPASALARKTDGAVLNRFGFSLVHIRDVLFANFVWSFRWIFVCMIIVAVIAFSISCAKKKKNFLRSLCVNRDYCIIAVAIIVFVLENCLYVTSINPRYYMLSATLLSVLGLCAFHNMLERMHAQKRLRGVFIAALMGVVWIQSFTTIDLVTLMLCPSYLSTGGTVISTFPQHSELYKDPYMDCRAEYNRQVLYYTKSLDKAYEIIDSDAGLDHSQILCSAEYNGGVDWHSLYTIWGYGYAYVEPHMYGHWNKEGKYRYLSYEQPSYSIDPIYVGADADLTQYPEDNIFYIEMPWGDTVLDQLQQRYKSLHLYNTVKYRGWILKIYKL